MITFEPDSPWQVGELVTICNGPIAVVHRVTAVEQDDNETQYTLERADADAGLYSYLTAELP